MADDPDHLDDLWNKNKKSNKVLIESISDWSLHITLIITIN